MHGGVKVLDVHGHMSAPMTSVGMYFLLSMGSHEPIPSPFGNPAAEARFELTEEAWAKSVGRHIQHMDDREIDVQLIGPRPYLQLGWMPDHLIPAWARFINDCIRHQVQMHPDRFRGAAQLPQNPDAPDASHMLDELRRCVEEYGFIAAYVSPDPHGTHSGPGLAERWWDPLYAYCQEQGLPIIVHGTNNLDKRIRHVPYNYQLGFVAEQYWANLILGHSDVFDRFPELHVVICHCGGALDRFIPTDDHLPQRDLSNNLFYDTCAHDVNFLEAAIKQRTPRRMLFGSEAPGSGGALRPDTGRPADDLVPVISAFDFLDEGDLRLIFHDNAAALFPAMDK